jgi:hypothetical protein
VRQLSARTALASLRAKAYHPRLSFEHNCKVVDGLPSRTITRGRPAHRAIDSFIPPQSLSRAGLLSRFAGRRWIAFSALGRCVSRGSVEASGGIENCVNVVACSDYIPQQQYQCAPRELD